MPSLARILPTWVLTVASVRCRAAAISPLDNACATCVSTSRSRGVSASRNGSGSSSPSPSGARRWAYVSSNRRVTLGATTASPLATARMPESRSLGSASLSRKPLAPARSAACAYSSRSKVVRISTRLLSPCSTSARPSAPRPARAAWSAPAPPGRRPPLPPPTGRPATRAPSGTPSSAAAGRRPAAPSSSSWNRLDHQARLHLPAAALGRAGVDRPAEHGGTLAHPVQAASSQPRRAAAAVVVNVDLHGAVHAQHAHVGCHVGSGMLERVGERLLHDPVGGQLDARRQAVGVARHLEIDRHARRAHLCSQLLQLRDAGLRHP